ncbi:2-amino-4-hydroxy-6-hydroxymethyldihydropteridine diphosphokinase [Pseudomonadota bacterium]
MESVYVSVGSNIDREKNISSAVVALEHHFGQLTLSPVYESESVGFDGAAFFNLVIGFKTAESLEHVIAMLREIEQQHGRERGDNRFAARTLDLDILLYGDRVESGSQAQLPRPEIVEYAFVLLPLSELIPNEVHPVIGKTYAQCWQVFSDPSQRLWRVDYGPLNSD